MELKVWVDGIQRVICGVTETSTCQDVVYALAHATGQTGRFTLVEKWRNSERLLAPQEQPMKVLTKWGEYANDVHFLMRRSSGDSKQATSIGNNHQNNKRQHDFLRSFSPTGGNGNKQKIPVSSKEIKKSLTFSCGHGSSGSVSSENSSPTIASESCVQSKSDTNRNAKNREGRPKQEIPKGVVRGIPQKPPRDSDSPNSTSSKIERPKYPPSYDEAVSRSSGRFPTSHLSLAPPANPVHQDEESPSSKRPHLSSKSEQFSPADRPSSSQRSNLSSHKTHHINDQNRDPRSPDRVNDRLGVSPSRGKSPSRSPEKLSLPPDEALKPKKILSPKIENEKQLITDTLGISRKSSTQSEDSNRDPQYQDLVRLVALQREKLDNQQSELTQFDAEIVYWESRLHEQEERLGVLQEEVRSLERAQAEQEGEIAQLDRRPFSEEIELGRQEERTLRSELTLARSQLANCETELLQCRQRIRLLLEEMGQERRNQEQHRKEQEEQERLLRQQVETLQQQLNEKIQETESQKSRTDESKKELVDLENRLLDKQKEMEKLMEEIREANLCSLSLVPSEEGKVLAEGNFYNRPGSTRKIIGSPRQLENAVPTNKNPHGVWV